MHLLAVLKTAVEVTRYLGGVHHKPVGGGNLCPPTDPRFTQSFWISSRVLCSDGDLYWDSVEEPHETECVTGIAV